MASPTKAVARTAAKKAPAKTTASRVRGRDTDSTRDAILRVVEQTRDEGVTVDEGRTHIMDVGAAADFAAGLPDKFLDCRLGKHQDRFADFDNHGSKQLRRGWSWRRYCPRCKFEVVEHFDSRGMKVNHDTPHYEPGYLAPKGGGRVDSLGRGQMRIEKVKRTFLNGKSAK